MKVTVFGGSGFLGSHVADRLSEVGHEVTVFDQTESAWLRDDQRMVVGDILDRKAVHSAVEGAGAVYNYAAIADLNEAIEMPVAAAEVNVIGNVNLLEACRAAGVGRFVYASTVYVYSRQGGFYRCSKQAAEHFVEEYEQSYGLGYTILRYGSLYGPRSDEHNGLWRIVRGAIDSGRIRYQGSREALREYIHVDDAARASVQILGDEFRNQHVVLTGQEPMRVVDLLGMIGEILGLDPSCVEVDETPQAGHYVRTPYAYIPKPGRKYVPPMHVDLGQGLLQLIDEVQASASGSDLD